MKNTATRITASVIVGCLSVTGFCQSNTMRDVAKTPAMHKVLLQKIECDKEEVRTYKAGHVIVGRVQLEGAEDPETIQSQMVIFEDGYFSDAVADLSDAQSALAQVIVAGDRRLLIRVEPAGAALIPGMPTSGRTEIEYPF